jgi:hypothetical protein
MKFRTPSIGALIAGFIIVNLATAADPVTFEDTTQTYDGSPKSPTLLLDPSDLAVTLRYTPQGGPPPSPPALFLRSPETLASSYRSLAFAAQQTAGIGELLRFEGPLTEAADVDVVLVTWAKAEDHPTLALANPLGYEHPISLTFYAVNSSNELTLIETTTQSIFIPWRPLLNPNGTPYLKNGFAFRASFHFDTPVPLAARTMVVVSFNTQNSGFEPIGSSGPYNGLNVGLSYDSVTAGIDDDPGAILWIQDPPSGDLVWSYPSTGFATVGLPMLRVYGPTPEPPSSPDAPTDAGEYLVTATAELGGGTPLEAVTSFTILPAPVTITLDQLVHLADGNAKSAIATSDPTGLPLSITYSTPTSTSSLPPSALGVYEVNASVSDPNYIGQSNGTMIIGHNFDSWVAAKVDAGQIPEGMNGTLDDPDFDKLVNLAEYAFALDPSMPSTATQSSGEGGGFSLVYRVNRLATDISYTVETTTTPEIPASWLPVATTDTVQFSGEDYLEIRAELPGALDETRRFARLAIRQITTSD